VAATGARTAMLRGWLPEGKTAAVCFSIDDIHPGTSQDAYEAGGDLTRGALGRMLDLQRRHPELKLTLCVTPDWRLKSLVPDTHVLRRIPWLRERVHWTRLHPPGHFRLDRYPALVSCLNGLERCEIVPHGLNHCHRGPRFAVEFQDESIDECTAKVEQGLAIFGAAKVAFVRGYVPPAWNAPDALIAALGRCGFRFLCSARDLNTAITPDAVTAMSGLTGVSLIYPQFVGQPELVHLSCNFQATSALDRAFAILDLGGVLHIKAHIFKAGGGHVMQDGLDAPYCAYLDRLFSGIKQRFGDAIWWPHLSEVAERARLAA
jgi:hypothetical protein